MYATVFDNCDPKRKLGLRVPDVPGWPRPPRDPLIPLGPGNPRSPLSPGSPLGPAGPCRPWSPLSPLLPSSRSSPGFGAKDASAWSYKYPCIVPPNKNLHKNRFCHGWSGFNSACLAFVDIYTQYIQYVQYCIWHRNQI